jgi:hypothetical protein
VLGQVGGWWSSWWGAKSGQPTSPRGKTPTAAPSDPPAKQGQVDEQPGNAPSPDENDGRREQEVEEEREEGEEEKPTVEEKEEGEAKDGSTGQEQGDEGARAERAIELNEDSKEDAKREDEDEDEEESPECLVKRNAFIGPTVYIREEEVPIAPYICFYSACLDGLKRTPAVGYVRASSVPDVVVVFAPDVMAVPSW